LNPKPERALPKLKTGKKNVLVNLYRRARINLLKIYHARGSAHEIALGAAIGVFWGVFPTFGLSTLLTLFLSRFLRFNFIVAVSAAFVSNPLTSPFLLMISYQVGDIFVHSDQVFDFKHWYRDIPKMSYTLFLGATLVSTVAAVIAYYGTYYAILKRKHSRRH
jgi:uncharacterized protein (DUF2062 family)